MRNVFGVLMGAALLLGVAQGQGAKPVANVQAVNDAQAANDTQDQLIKVLRVSPTLVEVVERDPSLLADDAYVSRVNPDLEAFLKAHPEVTRNPDYYLFSRFGGRGPRGREALERKIWPEESARMDPRTPEERVLVGDIFPFIACLSVLGALVWLVRLFVENRRWSRAVKLQMETHARLIDRFSQNQELLAYMETEAGKRFLEVGPMALGFGRDRPIPGAVARVLMPLQVGVVLTLLGLGLLMVRHSLAGLRSGLLVAGVVVLMPGLGFVISAGASWLLAGRLGLIPDAPLANDAKGRL
jgi:hypothetical protein